MSTKISNSIQVNQYDKIIRENLEHTLPVIIKDLLGFDIVSSEELPDDLQHTKERKPDALKKVTDSEGITYILHVEFQVANAREMVYRMAEYSIMLMRTYKFPVRQFVIYLKSGKPNMATSFDTVSHKYNYKLLRISEVNYRVFLKSKNPEVKMLGILGDLGNEDAPLAIRNIVEEINASTESDLLKNKYFKQLRIFVQLRDLHQEQLEKVMQSISTFFKIEKDPFYLKGERIGIEKGVEKGIAQGVDKGEKKKAFEIAANLKQEGIQTDIITKTTGLTIEQIEEL